MRYVLMAAALLAGTAVRAEHPMDHPSGAHGEKHTAVTKDAIAKTVQGYIAADSALKGAFLVYDKEKKGPLALTFKRVHDDKLCQISEKLCFACADFVAADGTPYDLDFFVAHGNGPDRVSEISIHKVAGVARYDWAQRDGRWLKSETRRGEQGRAK